VEEIQIRRLNLTQIAEGFSIVAEYYDSLGVTIRESPATFAEEYFQPSCGFWLASVGDEVAGCVALRELHGGSIRSAELKRMYVRSKFRSKGIGQALLEAAQLHAQACNYAELYLDTMATMTGAARLYERNGFQLCKRYNDNPQAAIFMKKRLNPAVKALVSGTDDGQN
jgi:ribosomal protein S18 acetylase RimI-like enzyme